MTKFINPRLFSQKNHLGSPSQDYHDYFIVDGRHIGDYEGMYQNTPDPWNIEQLGVRLDMEAALLLLKKLPFKPQRVLDAGAGSGFMSSLIFPLLLDLNPSLHYTLNDISDTALHLANTRFQNQFPDLSNNYSQKALDLRELKPQSLPWAEGSFDLIILCQVLWGILENLEQTLEAFFSLLRSPGCLLISQHFPGKANQSYGAERVSGPQDLSQILMALGFTFLNSLATDQEINHHWASLWIRV
ncbi:MAG: class I SAM-dependent methyltransferase [Deltaproteobacteria bacterium]|jgi:SAM-dependent methyltransferase|nr:class I SAM-dependent methyltransferase [Deltaproteobacteria bacterium]